MAESSYIDSLVSRDSIPVNVFVVGQKVFAGKEARQIFNTHKGSPLIEVDNHSYSHAKDRFRLYYENPWKVVDDIVLNEDTLHLANKIARLPGRNVWRVGERRRIDLADAAPAADSLARSGYTVFGWDLEWRYDSSGHRFYPAEQMVKQVRHARAFSPGHVVILCHDPMLRDDYFRKELRSFIGKVKSYPGWRFEYLSRYPR